MTVYKMVNKIILEKLKAGVVPWKKLWKSQQGLPAMSLTSGKVYNGVNQILLSCLADSFSSSPYFLTYKQAVTRGGYIRSGEKGFPVIYFKHLDKEEEDEDSPKFILRYFTVFHLDQCEDVELTEAEKSILESPEVLFNNFKPIEKAESILKSYYELPKVDILGSYNPLYNYALDTIKMPPLNQFKYPEEYYSTLFHEVIHSTGHKSRLDRFSHGRSGDQVAVEELVGEIGSAYLSYDAGIIDSVVDNNSAYIDYWYKKLDENCRLFTSATSKAEKAYNYIRDHSLECILSEQHCTNP